MRIITGTKLVTGLVSRLVTELISGACLLNIRNVHRNFNARCGGIV